ncbi:hypothetical protein D5S17_36000 [Pseudonocardiaceae bacterium YIM PH 21723]|nr:hypothetical protein D5S17_36000 [Pseudonocardiaceae bacterium YIM PH 21723]
MSVLDDRAARPLGTGAQYLRKVHFVGSLPPEIAVDGLAAQDYFLARTVGAELTGLPGGEDPRWIINYLESLPGRRPFEDEATDYNGLPDLGPFETVREGDSADYDSMPVVRFRAGHRPDPRDFLLGREQEVRERFEERRIKGAKGLAPHQVTIPSPFDLGLFVFGVPAAMERQLAVGDALGALRSFWRYRKLVTEAITQEIALCQEIAEEFGDRIIFQLESPAVLVGFDRTPAVAWPAVARMLARITAEVIMASPARSRFVLHGWCYGDLGHKPISGLHDLKPMVAFMNRLAWTLQMAGRAIPPLHFAVCDGQNTPPVDREHYLPLRDLRADVRVYAGVADEKAIGDSHKALPLIEQELRRPVDAVAAACGLGRRTPKQAEDNIALTLQLAAAPILVGSNYD